MSTDHETPYCPFCQSKNAELIAPFGTAQLVRQFYCQDCKSVFEYVRWRDEDQTKHVENSRRFIKNV